MESRHGFTKWEGARSTTLKSSGSSYYWELDLGRDIGRLRTDEIVASMSISKEGVSKYRGQVLISKRGPHKTGILIRALRFLVEKTVTEKGKGIHQHSNKRQWGGTGKGGLTSNLPEITGVDDLSE